MTHEYDIPLVDTTPKMHGVPVRDAQYLLKGNNRFEGLAPYKHGKIDQVYGPLTAQATARAKYWLGYPERAIDGVYGQTLYEYMRPQHWRPLPLAYRLRREQRLKALTPGLKAYTEAKKWIGYHEDPPYSNSTRFGVQYGWNRVAWCGIFESCMFADTGWKKFHFASVELIYLNARAGNFGMRLVQTPQTGDVICYSLHDKTFAHTAFFGHWVVQGKTFMDLGGNTSPTDFANGGEVAEQERSVSLVHAYVRVG